MLGIKTPGDDIVEAAGEDMQGKKQQQHPWMDPAFPDEGDLQDPVSAQKAIEDE